jgi:hypothetical protein
MNIENGTLTVRGQSIVLPEIQADATVCVWSVPVEYRENGLFVAVNLQGQPQEIPACSLADTEYLGQLDYPAADAHKVVAAKAAKLVLINAACEQALSELTSTYPPGELQSWPQQVQEAAALQLTPPGDTPLLKAIAEARGLSVVDLADRVQAKAQGYAALSGAIIGKRQALEDQLGLAQDLEAIGAISW